MSEQVRELTEATFADAVAKGVVLVDFWAPWCGPCKMQGPILDQVAPAFTGRAVIAKINVDEARGIAQQFGIRSIPALLLFKDGVNVQTLVGLQRPDVLSQALTDALKA